MLQIYKLELADRLVSQVKTLGELEEVRGSQKMLRTVETLPIHVQSKLDDYKEEERREEEKNDARRERRPVIQSR